MSEPTPKKPKKPKFKYTRELVKIAIADGMTQKEIGDLCRVEQSVVSGWQNGRSLAFEDQVRELKKRYGNRLNRTTSRVYLTRNELLSPPNHEGPQQEHHLDDYYDVRGRYDREEQEERARKQEDIAADQRMASEHLIQVEGPIALRYTFFTRATQVRRKEVEWERVPIGRWLVHRPSSGRYVLIRQEPRLLEGKFLRRWEKALQEIATQTHSSAVSHSELRELATNTPANIECADDSARWLSFVDGPMEAAALLEYCDTYFRDPKKLHGPQDERTVPFLVRKMLVEHGHEVPGLVRILDSE